MQAPIILIIIIIVFNIKTNHALQYVFVNCSSKFFKLPKQYFLQYLAAELYGLYLFYSNITATADLIEFCGWRSVGRCISSSAPRSLDVPWKRS